MIELIENTAKNATISIQSKVAVYNESIRFKHSNSIHACLSFHRGENRQSIQADLNRFIERLAVSAGVGLHTLAVAGLVIEAEEPVAVGMTETITASHAHLLVRSPKSRVTGKTVARVREHLPEIQKNLKSVSSMVLEPVFDLPRLLDYFTGEHNAQRPNARVLTINKTFQKDKSK